MHAKGTIKIKMPPPADIQKTLDLILQKLNQHDQFFVEVKNDISQVKTEIKNVNARVDEVKVEVKNTNKRIDEVKSEVKNDISQVKYEIKSEIKKINQRIDTIVELNHLKTDDNH